MASEDISKFLSTTRWENASDQCQDWLGCIDEIENAPSMTLCPQPLSGKGLLTYLSRAEASKEFKEELDIHGFMYYKLFTFPKVTQKQREKLHRTKTFVRHLGGNPPAFLIFQYKLNFIGPTFESQLIQVKELQASVCLCMIAFANCIK